MNTSFAPLIEIVNHRAVRLAESFDWTPAEAARFQEYMANYTLARLSEGKANADSLIQSEALLAQFLFNGVKAFQAARRREMAAPPTSAVVNFDEVQDGDAAAAINQVELIMWLQANVSDPRLRVIAEKIAFGFTIPELVEEYGLTVAEVAKIKAQLSRQLVGLRTQA